jgi:hypothetical protein
MTDRKERPQADQGSPGSQADHRRKRTEKPAMPSLAQITVTGARTQIQDFMRDRVFQKTKHANIVALLSTDDGVEARIITRWKDLLTLPPATPCLQTWSGQWSSDMFTYTVADVLRALLDDEGTSR